MKKRALFLLLFIGTASFSFASSSRPWLPSGSISVFFNTPHKGLTSSTHSTYPDIAIDDALVKFMETVEKGDYVYLCIQSSTTKKIRDAFHYAADVVGNSNIYHIMEEYYGNNRGENAVSNPGIYKFPNSIDDGSSDSNDGYPLMHNKFAVIINTVTEKGRVWTGSYNPNYFGTEESVQNAVWIESFELAGVYREEFLTMWNDGDGLFSVDKATHTAGYKKVDVEGVAVEVYFTPASVDTSREIEMMIERAQKSILVSMFTFSQVTARRIRDALVRAQERGVRVKGLVEDRQSSSRNTAEYLREQGIPFYLFGYGVDFHHKYAVIDQGTEDAAVITGSYNWTGRAANENDENFLVIYCPDTADRYYNEFMMNFSMAVGGDPLVRGGAAVSNARAWPSPVRAHQGDDRVSIVYDLSTGVTEATVNIYSITGSLVKSITADPVLPGAENEVEWVFSSSSPGPGLYIAAVEVETGDGVFYDTAKFAVIR